ncbi:MAG: DUF2062 domain-containing protein [Akkermansiaceae bacterium]|nr:DUF2062 domain-containing protein [Akkermansiaceae bacterium]MDP4647010.1 DUF2062 domain-containing protein [Akkermansiaceae bacterium]MDP4721291.1 DUF2062 domain-containing protein [Akkermansiaceae bacterium]MDP4778981.1 DUF2062 domain-containing protein [Akkermansiaceae bacterium]MDP4847183.1 DUF2062 domain-containing protein [Akkermansiaceae bacterium]
MPEKPSRIRRWIINPIVNQLKQGTSPERLSWSVSIGITLGIFPIMGSTSLMCFLFGWLLKLNQPVLHLFKTLTYPLHLPLILVFIRLGQKMNGVPLLTLSIPEMLSQFKDDPTQFARDFGIAALHGIEAWAICSIVLIPAAYFVALPLLKKLLPGKQAAV